MELKTVDMVGALAAQATNKDKAADLPEGVQRVRTVRSHASEPAVSLPPLANPRPRSGMAAEMMLRPRAGGPAHVGRGGVQLPQLAEA